MTARAGAVLLLACAAGAAAQSRAGGGSPGSPPVFENVAASVRTSAMRFPSASIANTSSK